MHNILQQPCKLNLLTLASILKIHIKITEHTNNERKRKSSKKTCSQRNHLLTADLVGRGLDHSMANKIP